MSMIEKQGAQPSEADFMLVIAHSPVLPQRQEWDADTEAKLRAQLAEFDAVRLRGEVESHRRWLER